MSASVGLGIVGAIIGAPFGLAGLGFAIGSSIGAALFAPDGPTIEQPSLKNLSVQSSAYGTPIPKVYGSMRLAGNIIWATNIRKRRHEEEVGGKGGPKQTSVTYTYDVDVAIAICEGEINGIRKMWFDGKLVYNTSNSTGVNATINQNSKWKSITIYDGDETQLPSPLIESFEGAGQVPAHRGLAYVVFQRLEITDYGARIPTIEFEVVDGTITRASAEAAAQTETSTPASHTFVHNALINDDGSFENYYVRIFNFTGPDSIGYYSADISLYTQRFVDGTFVSQKQDTFSIREYDFDLSNFAVLDTLIKNNSNIEADGICMSNVPMCLLHDATANQTIILDLKTRAHKRLDWEAVNGFARYNEHCYMFNIDTGLSTELYYLNLNDGTNAPTLLYTATLDGFNGLGADVFGWMTMDGQAVTPTVDQLMVYGSHGSGSPTTFVLASDIQFDSGTIYRYNASVPIFLQLQSGRANFIQEGVVDDTVLLSTAGSHLTTLHCFAYGYGVVYQRENNASPNEEVFDILYESNAGATTALSDVVTDLCTEAGLTAGDIDVTALASDDVRGYVRNSIMSARGAIEPLQKTYHFDAVESEGKIKFIKRGGSSVRTINETDLSAEDNITSQKGIQRERVQDAEIPRRIIVNYSNINKNYEQDSEYDSRLITSATQKIQETLPISLTATEARKIAGILVLSAWQSRVEYTIETWISNIDLEPADVITIQDEAGDTFEVLIRSVVYNKGKIIIKGVSHDASVYTSVLSSDVTDASDALETGVGPTELVLLDIPLLREVDDSSGLYSGVQGYLDAWDGAIIFRSLNSGDSYNIIETIYQECVMGKVVTAATITGLSHTVKDLANTIVVQPFGTGTLASVSATESENGDSLMAIGKHGRWELLSFENVTDNGDGTYDLDTFIRGRRGTDHNMDSMADDDLFVMLNQGGISSLHMSSDLIGQELSYQALSVGLFYYQAITQEFTSAAERLKPFSPVEVAGSRDGSNNLTITWTRRSRIGGELRDLVGVPLGETSESYEVDILDAGTVVRTIAVTAETASYSAAEQTTDGLTPGDPVDLIVYQLSSVVGRGIGRSETV